jgi:hypothetical protein
MKYGQIRELFKSLLNRSDCTNELADKFIAAGIVRTQRILRTPLTESFAKVTAGDNFSGVQCPYDLIEVISLDCDGKPLEFMPTKRFLELGEADGSPRYWTRLGSSMKLFPRPTQGQSIRLYYYGEFPEFTDDDTETPMSIIGTDVLIYGGLVFASDYFLDERKDMFEQRYMMACQEMQDQSYGNDGSASINPAYTYGEF